MQCPRKRKEYRKGEKWKYNSRNGGYDAQQAKCAPEKLDQISQGWISKYKDLSEDAGEAGIARGPSRLEDTDEEGVREEERSITRLRKMGMDSRALPQYHNYESPLQMSCEDGLRPAR